MAELAHSQITQFSEKRLDVRRKEVLVVGLSFKPQFDQSLSNMPNGVIDSLGNRPLNRLIINQLSIIDPNMNKTKSYKTVISSFLICGFLFLTGWQSHAQTTDQEDHLVLRLRF